jgi:2-polyprenyl-3-methyl-5-hydroxy-6-metoxy-1,4-benzoquinol methylase
MPGESISLKRPRLKRYKHMETKEQRVKCFFDQTDVYLKNKSAIRIRAEIVQELIGGIDHARILDIGCGDGSLSRSLLHETNQAYLLDISNAMLKIARRNTPPEFQESTAYINADFLKYKPAVLFDAILCVGVLAHVGSVSEAITHISNLLVPTGCCVLQFTDQAHLLARIQLASYNFRRKFIARNAHYVPGLSNLRISELLDGNNLRVERSIQYSLLAPGMGWLPQSLLYKWLKTTWHSRVFSRIGSEKILLVRKK